MSVEQSTQKTGAFSVSATIFYEVLSTGGVHEQTLDFVTVEQDPDKPLSEIVAKLEDLEFYQTAGMAEDDDDLVPYDVYVSSITYLGKAIAARVVFDKPALPESEEDCKSSAQGQGNPNGALLKTIH